MSAKTWTEPALFDADWHPEDGEQISMFPDDAAPSTGGPISSEPVPQVRCPSVPPTTKARRHDMARKSTLR